jgi:hypothetical protein
MASSFVADEENLGLLRASGLTRPEPPPPLYGGTAPAASDAENLP